MTIFRLKNTTNIYRIDAEKLGGERGYLALEDLRIKSNFPRSNMPIRKVGRGEKKPEREEKEKKEASGRKGGGWIKTPPWRHRSWRHARRQKLWRHGGCHVNATSASTPTSAKDLAPKVLVPRYVILAPITMAPNRRSKF